MSLQFDNVYASTNCTANLLLGQYASLLIQYIDTTINLTLSQLLNAYNAHVQFQFHLFVVDCLVFFI